MRSIAIVGASSDRAKFGNKAVRAYLKRGWRVFPVHPKEAEVEGQKAYARLEDVPRPIDRVSFYLPPAVGLKLLPTVAAVAPGEVWFNPGAESAEIDAEAKRLGLPIRNACAIVAIGESPDDY